MTMMKNNISENIKELKEKADGLSVLYVEDEDTLREKTSNLFKKIFPTVDVAKDGKEGLDRYKQKKYDIVVTDILMPNMDGFTLIKNILKDNDDQEIIISSAYNEEQYLDKAAELGISSYIYKPVKLNELVDVLNTSIEKIS
ncbi:response regulator [Sulfurimonas sp.]|uniref:response regulator n=1 Tax=Sulfurimonas sp. TaxID=2022749 RepID=UPI0035618AEC